MSNDLNTSNPPATLRLRAEWLATELPVTIDAQRPQVDATRLLHELEVHQIELAMQNAALRDARDEAETLLEKYTDLYDFAPVGYFTLTANGIIRQANLTGAALVGIDRSHLAGSVFALLLSVALRPVFQAFLARVFASDIQVSMDTELLCKGLPTRAINIEAHRSPDGQDCRVVVTDITERLHALDATAQLAAIVLATEDAIYTKTLAGVITTWNPAAERMYGYSAGEIVGKSIAQIFPSQHTGDVEAHINPLLCNETVTNFETERLRKDGTLVYVSLSSALMRDKAGQAVGVSIIARDITERKRAEVSLRVSEIRYRRLFETAHDGVIVLDPDTCKITDANPFMTKLLGYPRDELIGKELFEIGLLSDETASRRMFHKLKRNHEVRYENLPLETRDGCHQEVEVIANLYQEDGHAVIQCNIRDIAERKRAEMAQLRLAALSDSNLKLKKEIDRRKAVEASLQHKEQLQGQLLKQAHMQQRHLRELSHQILHAQEEERKRISRELHDVIAQTLVGISVHVGALTGAIIDNPKTLASKIANMHRVVEESLDIVHRFARQLRPTMLDDLGLIPTLKTFMKSFMEDTGVRASLQASGGIEQATDAVRTVLYRVAQEALTNVARHAKASQAEVIIRCTDGAIQMAITDNGQGFSLDGKSCAKKHQRLGLIGMRERVEMIGGTFSVESAPGHPTTVRVDLPVAKHSPTKVSP